MRRRAPGSGFVDHRLGHDANEHAPVDRLRHVGVEAGLQRPGPLAGRPRFRSSPPAVAASPPATLSPTSRPRIRRDRACRCPAAPRPGRYARSRPAPRCRCRPSSTECPASCRNSCTRCAPGRCHRRPAPGPVSPGRRQRVGVSVVAMGHLGGAPRSSAASPRIRRRARSPHWSPGRCRHAARPAFSPGPTRCRARRARCRRLGLDEGLEDSPQVGRRDAAAPVANRDESLPLDSLQADGHPSTPVAELRRVVDQIRRHLRQSDRVGVGRHRLRGQASPPARRPGHQSRPGSARSPAG